jgi:2-isopropylmalate synthase
MADKTKIIRIFDTTLRDGEQSPGATMNIAEKIKIAHQLVKLNVDIIEAGFPIASPGDFEAVTQVSKEIDNKIICGLARCRKQDIETAAKALSYAKKSMIHVFLATSAIHREFKLKKDMKDIIKLAVEGVSFAKGFTNEIEFSAEDAARTELPFLAEIVQAVIEAGATSVNIPDTVGYSIPYEFGNTIKYLFENVPNINDAVISVHCHNDLGLATANSLAAVYNGAQQVECTINGLGERAGNASLEEVAMALRTRKDFLFADTKINTPELCKTSKLVSNITGILVQPNKAIVGKNAFAHEAGIHQDGMLKERTTYEIMNPVDVGWGKTELVLGKHSGSHAFEDRLKTLGYDLKSEELEKAFYEFKLMCDIKKNVYDEDIEAMIENEVFNIPEVYELKEIDMNYVCAGQNDSRITKAKVLLNNIIEDKMVEGNAEGDGPIDAIYNAIEDVTGIKAKLVEYNIRSVTSGKDAQGEVQVKIDVNDNSYIGRSASIDVLKASAKAYVQAINRVVKQKNKN